QMSVVLGLFTGATSIVVTIMSMNMKIDDASSLVSKVYMTTLPMMLAASAALLSIAGIFAYLRLRRARRTIEQQT
ncbi:hypothetical protein, partial [Vibrio parahaemolyticus]